MEEWYDYSRFLIALVAIIDPFAAAPVFLSMTAGVSLERRGRAIRYLILTVFSVLTAAALTGDLILTVLGTSLDAFRVGGGAVLLTMAFSMLKTPIPRAADPVQRASFEESLGVVPLGVPLLAGPGAISATIIQMQRGQGILHGATVLLCILLACFVLWIFLRLAEPLGRVLGVQGLTVLNKLFGLLLSAVAVQIMANGLLGLFPGWRG